MCHVAALKLAGSANIACFYHRTTFSLQYGVYAIGVAGAVLVLHSARAVSIT